MCTHTQPISAMFRKRRVLSALKKKRKKEPDRNLMSFEVCSRVLEQCNSVVREGAFIVRSGADSTAVCGRSKLPRLHVDYIRKVDRASRSDSTKTKRGHFVFDSNIDWKSVHCPFVISLSFDEV